MLSKDKRSVDHGTLEYLRKLAVSRVREGEAPSEVCRSLGFCRTSIYRWLRAEKEGGDRALDSRKAAGPTPKLNEKQRQEIVQWIVGKDPRQYGFDFGLWTRQIVASLIGERFGVVLSLPAVGALLVSLGITPQKPLRRAYERDPEAIEQWKEGTFPKLRRKARAQGAEIFFLDETGVRSDSTLGKTYGLRGKTPVVATSGQRQSVNAISAVSSKGGFWYQVFRGTLNANRFIQMLEEFISHRTTKVLLVLDSLPAHRSKKVTAFVEANRDRLELHFLPTYAPDLNPDEFVWNYLKANGTSKIPLKQNENLEQRVKFDLWKISQNSELIQSFFKAESVAYAVY